jgi:hypothetical protein
MPHRTVARLKQHAGLLSSDNRFWLDQRSAHLQSWHRHEASVRGCCGSCCFPRGGKGIGFVLRGSADNLWILLNPFIGRGDAYREALTDGYDLMRGGGLSITGYLGLNNVDRFSFNSEHSMLSGLEGSLRDLLWDTLLPGRATGRSAWELLECLFSVGGDPR